MECVDKDEQVQNEGISFESDLRKTMVVSVSHVCVI